MMTVVPAASAPGLPFLTERQRDILAFILEFQGRSGVAPTHREICEHFGFSSYGTAHKHLRLLAAKGYLQRARHQKRGLRAIGSQAAAPRPDAVLQVAFLGRIAAGRPIEAVPGDEMLAVPAHLVGREGAADHYVLRVVGDSMIGEGIFDGDLVVVARRERAEAGEMVVALVGDEATLKRFYPEGEAVRLQPANPTMQPLRVPAAQVRVQGIVVGLMRKF